MKRILLIIFMSQVSFLLSMENAVLIHSVNGSSNESSDEEKEKFLTPQPSPQQSPQSSQIVVQQPISPSPSQVNLQTFTNPQVLTQPQYPDYNSHLRPVAGYIQIPHPMLSDEVWEQNHPVEIRFNDFVVKDQKSISQSLRNFVYQSNHSNQRTVVSRHSNALELFLSFYRNGAVQFLEKEDIKSLISILKKKDDKGFNKIHWLLQDDETRDILAQDEAIKISVSNHFLNKTKKFFEGYIKLNSTNFLNLLEQSSLLEDTDKEHLQHFTEIIKPHIEEEYQQKIDAAPFYKKWFFWKTATPVGLMCYFLGKHASATIENSFLYIQKSILAYLQAKKDNSSN